MSGCKWGLEWFVRLVSGLANKTVIHSFNSSNSDTRVQFVELIRLMLLELFIWKCGRFLLVNKLTNHYKGSSFFFLVTLGRPPLYGFSPYGLRFRFYGQTVSKAG
jgi:hypothetical protein